MSSNPLVLVIPLGLAIASLGGFASAATPSSLVPVYFSDEFNSAESIGLVRQISVRCEQEGPNWNHGPKCYRFPDGAKIWAISWHSLGTPRIHDIATALAYTTRDRASESQLVNVVNADIRNATMRSMDMALPNPIVVEAFGTVWLRAEGTADMGTHTTAVELQATIWVEGGTIAVPVEPHAAMPSILYCIR